MRDAPVAVGEARLLASGALLQQVAQAGGLVALLVIVTLLARRLSVAELGAYGLVASLAGYLLVVRNSVATSAVRAMAAAPAGAERARMFSAATVLYAGVGALTGLLIGLAGLAIAAWILSGGLATDARLGSLGLGLLTAAGIAASVNLDALRAERLFVRAAGLEIVAVALYLALMLALILGGADLAVVIAASGAMPLLSGVMSAAARRRSGVRAGPVRGAATRERLSAIVPTAGWLLAIELSNFAIYALGRVMLGAYRSPRTVGLFEGPVRAHNLLYALAGALAVPTVPTAARYAAAGDRRRLSELVLRGSRYTLALFVPVCVALICLAEPLLEVWLGERYGGGAAALAVLVSYWLLYGALCVQPGFLVGAGRARQAAQVLIGVAAASVVLSLVLTPAVGIEGPALGTAIPFALAFPLLLRQALAASGASVRELARVAWLPAYSLGALLAAGLLALRSGVALESLPAVMGAFAGGLALYWAVFYGVWLDAGERELMRGLVRRAGPQAGPPAG